MVQLVQDVRNPSLSFIFSLRLLKLQITDNFDFKKAEQEENWNFFLPFRFDIFLFLVKPNFKLR